MNKTKEKTKEELILEKLETILNGLYRLQERFDIEKRDRSMEQARIQSIQGEYREVLGRLKAFEEVARSYLPKATKVEE